MTLSFVRTSDVAILGSELYISDTVSLGNRYASAYC